MRISDRAREGESRMPASLGAQCAFGVFIAIFMPGIPEARAEHGVVRPLTPDERIEIARAGPVLLKPPASSAGIFQIAQAASGEPTDETVGRRDRPVVISNQPEQTIWISAGSA